MENRKSVLVMFTSEKIQQVLRTANPRANLDVLVRAELANRRTTRQVYESLMAHTKTIDAIAELSAEASEAFDDTLDALTGMCHPNCQYHDTPATPSVEVNQAEDARFNTNVTP